MKLYHYWRSSSSWRVRFALDYKKIPHELVPVSLLDGESESPAHLARSPAGFVPVLETDDGIYLTESLAIIHYLESIFPNSLSVLPTDPVQKAKALALAEVVNAGTQPLQNLPVTALLAEKFGATSQEQKEWIQHWISNGLSVYEAMLDDCILNNPSPYSLKSGFSIADICLLPQIYNAMRYEVKLEAFPKIRAVATHIGSMESFVSSHPDRYEPK